VVRHSYINVPYGTLPTISIRNVRLDKYKVPNTEIWIEMESCGVWELRRTDSFSSFGCIIVNRFSNEKTIMKSLRKINSLDGFQLSMLRRAVRSLLFAQQEGPKRTFIA
jgi:hypothetical protein